MLPTRAERAQKTDLRSRERWSSVCFAIRAGPAVFTANMCPSASGDRSFQRFSGPAPAGFRTPVATNTIFNDFRCPISWTASRMEPSSVRSNPRPVNPFPLSGATREQAKTWSTDGQSINALVSAAPIPPWEPNTDATIPVPKDLRREGIRVCAGNQSSIPALSPRVLRFSSSAVKVRLAVQGHMALAFSCIQKRVSELHAGHVTGPTKPVGFSAKLFNPFTQIFGCQARGGGTVSPGSKHLRGGAETDLAFFQTLMT